MLHNKKAVVGETLTWIVATLIIVVILIFSIFVTSLLSVGRSFGSKELSSVNKNDLLVTKSLTGYLLTTDGGEKVFELLKEEKISNDFNENLAFKIFRGLHSGDYFIVLDISGGIVRAVKNEPYATPMSSIFQERIYLAEDLELAVYFNHAQDEN